MSDLDLLPEKKRYMLSENVTEAIKTISYNPDHVFVAGSYQYKSIKYSADIDLSEYFSRNVNNVMFARQLQTVVRRIMKKGYCITDIKCGVNQRFNVFDIDKLGHLKDRKVVGFDKKATSDSLNEIKQYIKPKRHKYLVKLCNSSPDKIWSWFELRESIRKLLTVRWKPKEIIAGKKKLNDGIILLEDIVFDWITKIDILFLNNDNTLMEMSNVMSSYYAEKHGLIFLPINPDPENALDGIRYNMYEYFVNHNYFKTLKRLFSISILQEKHKLVKTLLGLFTSDTSALYQIVGNLEAIQLYHEQPKFNKEIIKENIEVIKSKLATLNIQGVTQQYFDKIDYLKYYNDIIEHFKKIINDDTLKFIKEHNLSKNIINQLP